MINSQKKFLSTVAYNSSVDSAGSNLYLELISSLHPRKQYPQQNSKPVKRWLTKQVVSGFYGTHASDLILNSQTNEILPLAGLRKRSVSCGIRATPIPPVQKFKGLTNSSVHRTGYDLDHIDPRWPSGGCVCRTCIVQIHPGETCPRSCRLCGSYPAT